MAKVTLNPILERVRGQVGDLVFKRYEDEVVISRKPDFEDPESTAAQLAHRERFREAALYGKLVMADPEAKALYNVIKLANNSITSPVPGTPEDGLQSLILMTLNSK